MMSSSVAAASGESPSLRTSARAYRRRRNRTQRPRARLRPDAAARCAREWDPRPRHTRPRTPNVWRGAARADLRIASRASSSAVELAERVRVAACIPALVLEQHTPASSLAATRNDCAKRARSPESTARSNNNNDNNMALSCERATADNKQTLISTDRAGRNRQSCKHAPITPRAAIALRLVELLLCVCVLSTDPAIMHQMSTHDMLDLYVSSKRVRCMPCNEQTSA